jgi:hypothetical protein
MDIYVPYTYHLKWTNHNIHYYGVRFAKNCSPKDLWVSYFTSSKYVEKFRKTHGEPDLIEIRKTFPNDPKKARLWEHSFLKKIKAPERNDFLNKSYGLSIPPIYGPKSETTKQKMRKPKTEKHRKNISLGRQNSQYTYNNEKERARKLVSLGLHNFQSQTNPNETILTCPHCNKKGSKPGMLRWHFDKCKLKINL